MNLSTSRTFTALAAATVAMAIPAALALGAGGGSPGAPSSLAKVEHAVHTLQRQQRDLIDELDADHDKINHHFEIVVNKLNEHTTALKTPNVVKVVKSITVPGGEAGDVVAVCPAGDQVISGGFDQGAESGVILRAVQVQKPSPGYEVKVLDPPGLIGNQPFDITAVAYCAPFATNAKSEKPKAVVLGANISEQ